MLPAEQASEVKLEKLYNGLRPGISVYVLLKLEDYYCCYRKYIRRATSVLRLVVYYNHREVAGHRLLLHNEPGTYKEGVL